MDARLVELAHIERVGPTRVADRQLALEDFAESARHARRDREEGAAGHVHLIPWQPLLVVHASQSVGELHAEAAAKGGGELSEACEHRDGVVPLEVVLEALAAQRHIAVAEAVEDASHLIVAQQCRVELDEGVELLLAEHVGTDRFDLLGRTAVHRGKGDGGRDPLRDPSKEGKGPLLGPLEGCACKQASRELVAKNADVAVEAAVDVRILHAVDEALHLLCLYSLEVVADRHVEDEARLRPVLMGQDVEKMDDDPGLEVFVIGLGQCVLRRPLDVVALVPGVDARLGDLELVHDLDGLELDESCADEVACDDVLRQLRMGASGGAERTACPLAEDLDRALGAVLVEVGCGDGEDGALGSQLSEDSFQQIPEGDASHSVRHCILLAT